MFVKCVEGEGKNIYYELLGEKKYYTIYCPGRE